VKFLAVRARGGSDERIVRILRRLQPGLDLAPGTRFTTGDHQQQPVVKGFTLAALFRGPLARITPLLWLVYLLSSALIYFMVFWTPMINEGMGFSVSAAATIAAAASVATDTVSGAVAKADATKGPGILHAECRRPVSAMDNGQAQILSLTSARPSQPGRRSGLGTGLLSIGFRQRPRHTRSFRPSAPVRPG
jgi:hypothetical protein